jgi:spermidine/putrescine transport system permease protein
MKLFFHPSSFNLGEIKMSTPSIALSPHQRSFMPTILMGVIAFVVAIGGLAAVLWGLLNLDQAVSYGLIAVGVVVFMAGAVWGARQIRVATGISVGQQLLLANAVLVFAFFYIPILVLIIFSFNAGRNPAIWEGLSLRWYGELINDSAILPAFTNTIIVAVVSTVLSTIIGTLISLAMERHNFPLKLPFDAILYMPIIIPEIVIALATLLFFIIVFNMVKNLFGVTWGLGRPTIIIAHVAFTISFVATIVRARLIDMDPNMEQAARDLYADEWQTFRRVTLPLLLPGVISGALMGFTLSLDDFLITFFVSGPGSTTLPVLVYSKVKFGVTPDLNALATLLLVFSIGLVLLSQFLQRRN